LKARSSAAWVLLLGLGLWASAAQSEGAYRAIAPARASEVIVLTDHDLNVEQVIAIARDGAQVRLSPDAKQRQADAYGLLLEGSAEGISIYGFNRGAGGGK
jgi:histidine ammonia-lyase